VVRGSIVSAVMLMLTAALNHRIKISLHLTFACFCGILLARVRLSYGLPVLLLIPALIWSRVVLSRHGLPETLCGLILGLFGAAGFIFT
jgi:membrane-associated phospholipid phosphatase